MTEKSLTTQERILLLVDVLSELIASLLKELGHTDTLALLDKLEPASRE